MESPRITPAGGTVGVSCVPSAGVIEGCLCPAGRTKGTEFFRYADRWNPAAAPGS